MSRSSRGRTEVFDRAQGRHRLDFARKCHETAELVGSDRDDTYAGKVAVSLYVLAGIASADAIGAGSIGMSRSAATDHGRTPGDSALSPPAAASSTPRR